MSSSSTVYYDCEVKSASAAGPATLLLLCLMLPNPINGCETYHFLKDHGMAQA